MARKVIPDGIAKLRLKAETDFDAEGLKIEAERAERLKEVPESKPCPAQSSTEDDDRLASLDVIWRHPTSSGRLYVGNLKAALSRTVLRREGITRIVTCTADVDPRSTALYREMDVQRYHYNIIRFRQRPQKTLEGTARFFAPLLGWVEQALEEGQSVLIHCVAGAHRAGTSGVACLMYLEGLGAGKATAQAQADRGCIDTNVNNCGLDKLLCRLHRANLMGLLTPAVSEAKELGFEEAFAYQFSFMMQCVRCCCCRRPRLKPQAPKVALKNNSTVDTPDA